MNQNNEIRWAGRVYRHASPDGGEPGGGGGEPGGEPDPGAGGGEPDPGAGGEPDGGSLNYFGEMPEDWRQQMAGDDEARLTRLERYNTFQDFVDGAFSAHDKVRSGTVQYGLPENASDEQIAEYRQANGIPDDGVYVLTPPEGVEFSTIDQDMMKDMMAFSAERGVPQEVLNGQVNLYLAARDQLLQDMATQDNLDTAEFQEMMKGNWGANYDVNMNRAMNRINFLPEEVRDSFKNARLPDGRSIMNSPEIMNWIVGMDREIIPLDPFRGGNDETTIDDARRIKAEGEERMKNDREAWYKDTAAQQKYMQAIEFLDKIEGSQ